MSLWHDVLLALLLLAGACVTLGLLAAALLHVRFQAAWFGMWVGATDVPQEKFLRIEYGFPGFMRTTRLSGQAPDEHPDAHDAADASAPSHPSGSATTPGHAQQGSGGEPDAAAGDAPQGGGTAQGAASGAKDDLREGGHETEAGEDRRAAGDAGSQTSAPRQEQRAPRQQGTKRKRATTRTRGADPHRHRRALFRFVTDGTAWKLASRYFLRVALRAFRLPGLQVELSVGHPDPAWLGRFAGRWYAVTPFLPADRARMHFRFQDRHPSFGIRARGGFSLLSFLWFLVLNLLTFPWIRLGRRAWMIWRDGTLEGWRAWTYRKIQTL